MLRQVSVRSKPTTAATGRWCCPSVARRQFRSGPQHNAPNYAPPPPPSPPHPPHGSRGRRLKDMAIGSGLTVAAYGAYQYYQYRQLTREIRAAEETMRKVVAIRVEMEGRIEEAVRAGDDALARELTFELPRRTHGLLPGVVATGPLPGFPEGSDLRGREKVAEEDTLVFIESHEGVVTIVEVAVNAAPEDLALFYSQEGNPAEGHELDPREDKLAELMVRFDNLDAVWRREGRIPGDDPVAVSFSFRMETVTFLHSPGSYRPFEFPPGMEPLLASS